MVMRRRRRWGGGRVVGGEDGERRVAGGGRRGRGVAVGQTWRGGRPADGGRQGGQGGGRRRQEQQGGARTGGGTGGRRLEQGGEVFEGVQGGLVGGGAGVEVVGACVLGGEVQGGLGRHLGTLAWGAGGAAWKKKALC